MVGSVYVIKAGDAYKIGFTGKSVGDRVKQLQIGNPNKMKLVCSVSGTRREESILHEALKKHRLNGEWYSSIDPIKNHLNEESLLDFIESQPFKPGIWQDSTKTPLGRWMIQKGYTLLETSGAIGISESYVSLLVRGRRGPSPDTALQIERLTGRQVTKEELMWPELYGP